MKLRPQDLVTLFYLGCVGSLIILFRERVEDAWFHALLHLAWISAILGILWKSHQNPSKLWMHLATWYHIISIPLAFRELHYLVHPINPKDLDGLFVEWDFALFGVHPTVWLEQYMHPLLTEYLQIIYTTFYFLPILLGLLLWRSRNWEGFQAAMVGVVSAFYISYLGYFAFPALGPRFEIAHLQSRALEGLWLTNWIRESLDRLELLQRDAFPSGHVGISLLVLYYVWRYCRRAFPAYLVVVTSLVFSTVYLRYHYVVDVMAGVLLALVSGWLASLLRRWLPQEELPWRATPVDSGQSPQEQLSHKGRSYTL
ncbi:MAG: phosphatase PAP2 family protein [bacterium]